MGVLFKLVQKLQWVKFDHQRPVDKTVVMYKAVNDTVLHNCSSGIFNLLLCSAFQQLVYELRDGEC